MDAPPIGIMQGRLSPPSGGRIQSFPVESWREEFGRAREVGLACIEWVYEAETEDGNPLAQEGRVAEIAAVAETEGVRVSSVCADYYMSVRLVDDADVDSAALGHLAELLARTGRLGARYVVLPFVDESRLRTPREREALKRVIAATLPAAERADVELHLETDLSAAELVDVLAEFEHPLVRANYDTGNSAALRRDPDEELPLLAPFLGSVHVKDRLPSGGTVPLGRGGADLRRCLELIQASGFRGPYILQAARDDTVDEVELARRNRLFVERLLVEAA